MFGSILKGLGNVITSPFKSVGSILGGKGNIGDLLNIGGTLFGANLFNPGQWGSSLGKSTLGSLLGNMGLNPEKMNTSDFLNLVMSSQGGQGGPGRPGQGMNFGAGLQGQANQLSQLEMLAMLQNYPKRLQSLNRAYDFLSPQGATSQASTISQFLQAQGRDQGRQDEKTLTRRGYSSGTAAGANLAARNRASTQAGQATTDILNPMAASNRAMAQANVYSPGNLQGGGLNMLLALQNAGNNQRMADAQYNATKPASTLESILGIAGSTAPYWLDQLFPQKNVIRSFGNSPYSSGSTIAERAKARKGNS